MEVQALIQFSALPPVEKNSFSGRLGFHMMVVYSSAQLFFYQNLTIKQVNNKGGFSSLCNNFAIRAALLSQQVWLPARAAARPSAAAQERMIPPSGQAHHQEATMADKAMAPTY